MSQDDCLYPSSKKNYQVNSKNNNLRESIMIKEKVINNLSVQRFNTFFFEDFLNYFFSSGKYASEPCLF